MYEYLDRRYALALYEVAEENAKVEEYIQELKEIVDLINNNEELLKIVQHPEVTTSKKKKIFKEIFKGKIDDNLLAFLLILIEKERIMYLKEKVKEMEKIHLEKQNIIVAHIKSVVPLSKEQKNVLIEKLSKKYQKNIMLKEQLDKSLIGGLYVRIGDDVIDGTIKGKFQEIRKRVSKN
ncbi:ATP synthase F0F1 subunit delta [Clostridium botulinum]|uniref:ATP synthase subunit delta n=1 Tax=Clostridium botulinum C/D str. DC5 TaxID=1443128 RepID=A0A0A0IEK0_CLOBO|nr:F0F1 ATP synthase subunit delta [Clostridium botulinum]KEI00304.1 ATP synthase F0F1 subunit delta [Clostridium botulinum C/D str. BKT75002]KEI08925.1 ATP synthase F0F1 subunit delta [Clostridium botulinum C/D str. BKT2873]KGM93838.1 ATP synthase F0F1 subunit delta [Clostridium botulinum D str. CCUG 7971]KGM99397.1 ATP synthase F0F1 subunit delta [Clostridium botulinum C/D str. DC5]KOC55312.1 ATP synthase F0F1 subunit delta [Clostridium botulinum]